MRNVAPLTQRLREEHRRALVAHFLRLGAEDRRLRFAASLGDEAVREYCARIDFDADVVFGVQEGRRLVGVVHVAFGDESAELGLSVLPRARGRGIGGALFARAVSHLRNRGTGEVYVLCLPENQPMLHLARKHRMGITTDGTQAHGHLKLEPADPQSRFHEWLHEQQAAALGALRNHLG